MWEKLDKYPPLFLRLMCRHRYGPPLTTQEISERSGLNEVEIEAISNETTWNRLTVDQARRYMKACGIDLFNGKDLKRVRDYIRLTASFAYLKRSPVWETYYKPKLLKWMEYYERKNRQGHGDLQGAGRKGRDTEEAP